MPVKPMNTETWIKIVKGILVKPEHQQAVERELLAAKGDLSAALKVLKDKLPISTLQKLQVADSVASAVGDQPEVAQAILGRSDIKTQRDLANLNVDKLTALIAPAAKPRTKAYQQAKSQAIAINSLSFVREPLTVLQRMTHEGELPVSDEKVRAGLGTFLQRIPAGTDIRITPLHKVLTEAALKGVPKKQQAAVLDQAKALWRSMAITPVDAPQALAALMKTGMTSAFLVGEKPESTFLNLYRKDMGEEVARQVYTNAINARIRNEQALITMREAINGTGLAAIDGARTREERLADARRYVDEDDVQLNFDTLFGGMDHCECNECQSVYSAPAYFVELLNFLRNNNLGPDPATGESNPNIRIDLKNISGTPLEKLFWRRPDLGDLELSCENTNTVLPYIDLVNEVMESYVLHRADYASSSPKLDVYNISDETEDELLAQPQHTTYQAYCILKNEAVYPFTLPFHQPIEAARIFLKYLGTSRYEVLDSFRAAHESQLTLNADPNPFSDSCALDQQGKRVIQPNKLPRTLKLLHDTPANKKLHDEVLNRAADAEFLGLTQEEYTILTKEAFWPKDYFEITQKTHIPTDQYQQTIGVKPVYEYYGYATEEALSDLNEDPTNGQTGLCFVKQQFLPRTGIQYTDLVDLLQTRYINPLYPRGLAETILENIRTSYGFLQTLVDTSSSDPKIRFSKVVDYLEESQAWISVPQVLAQHPIMTNVVSNTNPESSTNHLIQEWVYSCFEKLGKLIVLESGDGPQLPIEGRLFIVKKGVVNSFASLRSDGSIVDPANGLLVGNVSAINDIDSDGNPVVYTGPVNWTKAAYGADNIDIKDENDQVIGSINSKGIWMPGPYEQITRVEWIAPIDTCSLEKVRLMHLDGTPLAGDGPQLPIEGMLFVGMDTYNSRSGNSVGVLRKDGTIVDDSKTIIAHVTPSGDVIDNKGNNFAKNFPPYYLLNIFGDNSPRVAWITPSGIFLANERRVPWLPSNLDEYDRIQRFIRLWHKLGWTIDDVDKALEGLATKTVQLELLPRKTITPPAGIKRLNSIVSLSKDWTPCCDNETEIGDITPDFLHQLVAVKKLLDRTGLPLVKLLSFWTDISAVGDKSLYSRLFLTHNMLGIDPVFQADANGNYLTGSEKITGHLPVLMAALNLKADDITTILGSADALTLHNVSQIYRHGLLAKALHVKVADLAKLKELFGNPFVDADATLKLFETWEKMEAAGFTFEQLAYSLKGLDFPLRPLAPSQKTILQIAKTLYDGLNAIDHENQDLQDGEQATPDLIRAKAGLLFEPPVVEKILNLLNGTTVYTTNAPTGLKILVPDALAKKLKYCDQKDILSLKASIQVTGILTRKEQAGAKALCKNNQDWQDWSDAIDRVYKQARSFFNDVLADILPGRTTIADKKNNRLHPLAGDMQGVRPNSNTGPQKCFYFLYYYLPKLRQRLEQRFIADTISAALGLSAEVTDALLLEVLSADTPPLPAMAALQSIKNKPAALSGWKGYLIPPADGSYAFVASVSDTDPNTPPAALAIEGFNGPLEFVHQQEDPTNVWSTDPISLKNGKLYLLTIADRDAAQLQWRTTAAPATPIPTSALLPDFTNQGAADILIKLYKAAIVVNGFNLSADEVYYFQAHGADFDNINFNSMTLASWQRIADYVALRSSLPAAGMPLLDLFAWASQPQSLVRSVKLVEQLAAVTQWDLKRINALIADDHFDLNEKGHFKNEVNLVGMQKALAVADKVGVDIDRLFNWAVPGSKFWPCHTIAEDIRMAMRFRFDEEDWEQAVKPLSDQLREMQKQALISFLLIQPDLVAWPVVDADSLFEFFLIDVQMQAERQTSRLVQAISSVQLFIKRCLMGLEEKYGVPFDAIDRDRWDWMQKYRVWEANRKVFLYPENWIQPELRDDKSPFYKELESELLQKDINSQTVEEALKNYLYKVDEVSDLKVVGLFAEPALDQDGKELNEDDKTVYTKLHIFARTRNVPYIFYYRCFDIGIAPNITNNWFPWEKMQVDIPSYDVDEVDANGNTTGKIKENGTYLIPVVWNNRLLVFFPQFMKKTVPAVPSNQTVSAMGSSNASDLKPTENWEIKLAWSEYRKGKWTQKQVSAEPIYSTIAPGTQLSQYMFFPTIFKDSSKIAIDIYNENTSTAKPPEISLVKAELFSLDRITNKIDVKVFSLIDGSEIAEQLGVTGNKNTSIPLKVLATAPNVFTKAQSQSFRVEMYLCKAATAVAVDFNGKVILTFSDTPPTQLSAPPKDYRRIKLDPIIDEDKFFHIEPDGPTLGSVKLFIKTGSDDKNSDTTYDVVIYDQNWDEFAVLTDTSNGIRYAPGSIRDDITVPIINNKITKAECQGFHAVIIQHVSSNDNWVLDAVSVTLDFNDGSPFTANGSFILSGDNAQNSVTSYDTFTPAQPTTDNQLPNAGSPAPGAVSESISQRFEFSGNKISVANILAGDPDPIPGLTLQGYSFHYEDGEDWKTIHSLQAEENKAPELLGGTPYFEDPQVRFHDTDAQLAIDDQDLCTFSYLDIKRVVNALNTDKIADVFKYYLGLYDFSDPLKSGLNDIYGGCIDDQGNTSYHELKRPYSVYNWEVGLHAPMQLVDRLLTSQQFDQAIAMCQYVFNPMAKSGSSALPLCQGQWSSVISGHILVPMQDGKVLDWVPGDGSWRLWNYDPTNTIDCLPNPPVSNGQWSSVTGDHILVPMHDGKVLDWVPGDGSWRLWNYDPTNTSDCLPNPPVSKGQWGTITSGHALVPMQDGKVLDWVSADGSWRLWNYDPTNPGDCLPNPPVSNGQWSSVSIGHILLPMRDGKVLDWVPGDGSWRLWNYDPTNPGDCLPNPPVSNGQWRTITSGHGLVSMQDGKVLDWVPADGSWRLWNYYPTNTSDCLPGRSEYISERCWQFPPFKEIDATNVLETLFESLKPGQPDSRISQWRDNPFQPHVVARERPSAYMKYVVMKYIEILIAYGDYYFRQNTMESIPLAIECYILASHLYGPRGQKIPPRGKIEKQTYNSLMDKWDAFGNAMVEMELAFPFCNQTYTGVSSGGVGLANVFGSVTTLYFGIPDNPNLTALRDTIDDRLMKIRACENIEGIFQQLPLFEPPIDPALLVQAAAQGLSLSSVLNDMNSPMPNYRFYYLLQKALELCGELKTLGNAFLSAKEKGDAEALSNMRASHDTSIQNLIMEVRIQQLEEANKSLNALQQNRKGPKSRMEYYLQLIGEDLSKASDDSSDFSELPNQIEKPLDESGLKLIKYEKEEMDKASEAADWQIGIGVVETLGSILHIVPDIETSIKPWGFGAGITIGGTNFGNANQAVARGFQTYASNLSALSSMASRKGSFLRQLQDRVQQANTAGYELKNIDKQILTQQIRIAIANQEISNQQAQIDNAAEVEDFLHYKYTNEELYTWMDGNIQTIYYQAYTLAYDLAKKAEKAYRFERGLTDSNFIQFGYWDAGRDGLLAGERLYLALKQLEAAYQENRGYDYEITKHVSLRQIDPLALIQFREKGSCEFAIPEVLFDMDFPGHYMRRIKSVAITIPCIVGPYTSLNCTLRLLEHKYRTNAIVSSGYAERTDGTDVRFSTVNVPITSIAVSSGQNDSGVFELNFRDERYIPFEGAGTVSKWRIELPERFRQFDYDTISDVIVHLRYTALEGGDTLQQAAEAAVADYIDNVEGLSQDEGLFAVLDLKHDFSNEWYQTMLPSANATEQAMPLNKLYERLPIYTKGYQPNKIIATDVSLFPSDNLPKPTLTRNYQVNGQPKTDDFSDFEDAQIVSQGHSIPLLVSKNNSILLDNWQLSIPGGKTEIENLWIVIRYELKK